MLSPAIVPDVLDCAPDAVLVVDRAGTIVFANRQVSALFGHAREEVVGTSIDELLPERFRRQHTAYRQRYAQQARVRPMGIGLDLRARRRDGSEFPVEISLSPIAGSDGLIAAAIRDATERLEAQAQLKRARESADSANLAKSRFLATASHDLRQPLQTLALLNGAMRHAVSDPSLTDVLQQQEQAIDAMARLLNALLDISKLESGAIKPEVTDFTVAAIFAEMRAEFAQLAAQKGLELKVESCEDAVQSDASLVSQVLRNLISNAIKYTQQGWVLLRCLHGQAGIRLEVLDTGIGIPQADLPHIFEEFYQVGVPANASRNGYGLGLSIVRRITDLLGASLEVHSEPGKGSAFSVALPAAAGRPGHVMSKRRAAPMPPPMAGFARVLLVEDDPAVRKATQMLLKVAGHATVSASTCAEAIEQAAAHPDITLMVADYHLAGGETGLQVIAAVRERLGWPVRAVLVSGDTSSAVQMAAQDSRLRIASKPINADELLALLQQLIAGGTGGAPGV